MYQREANELVTQPNEHREREKKRGNTEAAIRRRGSEKERGRERKRGSVESVYVEDEAKKEG